MNDPVTEDELVRARLDPVFRRQFLAQNLNRFLEELKKMRLTHQNDDTARQIRKGATWRKACRSASKGRSRDAGWIEVAQRGSHRLAALFCLAFSAKNPINPGSIDPGWELNGRPARIQAGRTCWSGVPCFRLQSIRAFPRRARGAWRRDRG
jgi:hypothetical protein